MRYRPKLFVRLAAVALMVASMGLTTHASAAEAQANTCPSTVTLGCTYGQTLVNTMCSDAMAESQCQAAGGSDCHENGWDCNTTWPFNGCDFYLGTSASGTYYCY